MNDIVITQHADSICEVVQKGNETDGEWFYVWKVKRDFNFFKELEKSYQH